MSEVPLYKQDITLAAARVNRIEHWRGGTGCGGGIDSRD